MTDSPLTPTAPVSDPFCEFRKWQRDHYNVPGGWVSSGSEPGSLKSFDSASASASDSDAGSVAVSDADSDAGSYVSETSTVEWDHEPYETFQHRVLSLARRAWPEWDNYCGDIHVERLKGGSYNRVIGINLALNHDGDDPDSDGCISYILRIPREDAVDLDKQIGAHLFAQRLPGIKVAELIEWDKNKDNEIGAPYVIQNRVAATDLKTLRYPDLDHATKCRIAREVGGLYRRMLSIKSSVIGDPMPEATSRLSTDACKYVDSSELQAVEFDVAEFDYRRVRPFADSFFMEGAPPREPALAKPWDNSGRQETSLYHFLKTTFTAQRAKEVENKKLRPVLEGVKDVDLESYDNWLTMVDELQAAGWLDRVDYCLAHLDFYPYNMLFDPDAKPGSPSLTILDWDQAGFVPSFMLCRPAYWIWNWTDAGDEFEFSDETLFVEAPQSVEACELKSIFEEAAGPEYMFYAYQPAYRHARRLFRFAVEGGLAFCHWYPESQAMLKEWAAIRHVKRE